MINTVTYDFNLTFFNYWYLHIKAWGIISKKLRGYPLTLDEMNYKLNGFPNEKILRYVTNDTLNEADLIKYSALKEELYRNLVLEIENGPKLIDGAVNLFNFLNANNIPFTISSASIKENIDFFVETFNLDKYFDVSTIVYDDGTYSNKQEMYEATLKNMNFNPKTTLIFEDSIAGIKSAFNVGVENVVAIYNPALLSQYKDYPIKKIVTNYNDLNYLFSK